MSGLQGWGLGLGPTNSRYKNNFAMKCPKDPESGEII
jgi:hypothetical protein